MSSLVTGDKLVLYSLLPKPAEVAMKFNFQSKRWYHVVVTHSSGGPLTPSTVRLYVNGEQVSSSRFKFPKVLSLVPCQRSSVVLQGLVQTV